MKSIVVTGAAGSVGRRLIAELQSNAGVDRIVALDRRRELSSDDNVTSIVADLRSADLAPHFEGCDIFVHLAEGRGRDNADEVLAVAERALEAAAAAGVRHVIVISSAMVYGGHADNPVPITEAEPARPNPELGFAVAKARLEQLVTEWANPLDVTLSILRPTTTLSEREASWVARSLRTATAVRPAGIDPPVQFLHHDDLASALVSVIEAELDGLINVAADGWIAPEAFRELAGSSQLRVPDPVREQIMGARRRLNMRPIPDGLDAYVTMPWVIANDRLRQAGWTPRYSNEEAFVIGTPAPPWAVTASRRQEIALGVAGAGVAAALGAAGFVAKRVTK